MKNIFTVTRANLRKSKGQTVGLLLFVMMAAMLLNIGLLLQFRFGGFFENRAEELHAPHYALIMESRLFNQSQLDYLNAYPGVTETEHEQALYFMTELSYNGGKLAAYITLLNTDTERGMNGLTLIEGSAPGTKDEICLPFLFKVGSAYQVGDAFTITTAGIKSTFRISGFTEDIFFGTPNNNVFQAYLAPEGMDWINALLPGHECEILRVRMQNPQDSDRLYQDAAKTFWYESVIENADTIRVNSLDWNTAVLARTMMPNITAVIMVMFAVMITLISLLVARFRIRNTIEESMTNIGALKAVGYTGRQLLGAMVLQFGLIGGLGALLGLALSYAVLPAVSGVLEAQTALMWNQGFDAPSSLATFVFLLGITVVTAGLTARRIRALSPLAALRQGLVTHSFKKNHFPLDKSKGGLSWLLAAKAALQSGRQMLTIALIVAAVTFAAAVGASMYQNFGLNPNAFGRVIAGEVPDSALFAKDADGAEKLYAYIQDSGDARKLFYYQDVTVMAEDAMTGLVVSDDFSQFEGGMLYEGRYPKHDNEAVIGGAVSRLQSKGIGDTIKMTQGGQSAEYLIVGLIQTTKNLGNVCGLTVSGLRQIQPDFRPNAFYVYLHKPEETGAFVKEMSDTFGPELDSVLNLYELMEAQLSAYGDIFQTVAFVLIAVTALIIFLVLYLMLKTVILRGRHELGIQKALGFTTRQLMNQFSLQFMPSVVVGIAAGGLAGILGFNAIFVALTKSMGIMNASLPVPVGLTAAMCVALALLAYIFALLIASRIRKVSAYALVSE
jgi:putative ABC transport system permease protein